LIYFENYGGSLRYELIGRLRDEITLHAESLHGTNELLETDLENALVEHGLYRAEAQAMIETWRDSWFEEGARLFYIVPGEAIDSILPLDIRPAPAHVARVFVGRMEVITPAVQEQVKQAL